VRKKKALFWIVCILLLPFAAGCERKAPPAAEPAKAPQPAITELASSNAPDVEIIAFPEELTA